MQQKNTFRYLLFAIIGSLLFIQTNAQRRGEGQRGNPERNNSRGGGREQAAQQPQRHWDNPRASGQASAPRGRDFNRPEQSPRPRQIEQQPHVNNNPRPNHAPGSPGNNPSPRPRQVYQQPHVNNNPSRSQGQGGFASRDNNDRRGNYNRGGYDRGGGYGNDRRPVHAERRPNHYWPQHNYSPYNPGWRYAQLPRRNSIITSFAFPFVTINFGGYGYRYCDGVYYRPYDNVYRVVAPPLGIYINVLPFGYRRIVVNDYPYYYYNGTYYDEYEDSYRVVAPPVGAIVESIPEGYETIVIDGETYYKVDDVQYKPVVQDNGEIWYQVIKVG